MGEHVEIKYGETPVSWIKPMSNPDVRAERGFDVVKIGIPLQIEMRDAEAGKRWVFSDLAADVYTATGGRRELLGPAALKGDFSPAIGTGKRELPAFLMVRCSPRALACYETARDGGPVQMQCEVSGRIYGMRSCDGSYLDLVLEPRPIYGRLDLQFSRESWTKALRSCGLSASVLVEIPFPLTDKDNLEPGLRALLGAFEAFEQGGSTAWKSTIAQIRPYLEKWRKDQPLSGVAPTDPRDNSPVDRTWKLLNLREALYKCCHVWLHELNSSCTRQEAVLALATFACLLDVTGARS